MAIPVARVHLAMAHAVLPALLPTPPKCKMLPLLPTPPCVAAAAILPNPKRPAKPSRRAGSDERWDARKKPASPRSASADSVRSSAARRVCEPRKNATSPAPKPGQADSVDRWDAHKKAAASPASSSASSSFSGTSPHVSSKKLRQPQAEPLEDDGETGSTGSSNDVDMEEEEEIVYKPPLSRAMYAGPGFVVASSPAGIQQASHANSAVGSRCIAA